MQTNRTRAAGAVAAIMAAAGVGYGLRPTTQAPAALAARNPAVEVRTVVIRRTIRIVRRERARPAAGPGAVLGAVQGAVQGAVPGSVGAPAAPTGPAAGRAPLTTKTSAHGGTVSAGAVPAAVSGGTTAPAVRTRTSSRSAAGGVHLTTRTSGAAGGERERGDGGGDN